MDEIDASELPFWYAMESIDPWSDRRTDAYLAQIAYAIAATWSKGKQSFSNFFLEFDPQERDRKAIEALKAWGKVIKSKENDGRDDQQSRPHNQR